MSLMLNTKFKKQILRNRFLRMTKILILSKHLGCRLLQNLFATDQQFQFAFINSVREIQESKGKLLIINQQEYKEQDNVLKNLTIIALKDTQKSDASILALSGQLCTFGQNKKQEFVPSHIVSFITAISLSILIRQITLKSLNYNSHRIFFVSLVDLTKYIGAFNISAKENGFLNNPLGKNLLDGGAPFYRLYKCKQNIIAVGNLEPKFYQEMVKAFKLDKQKQTYLIKNQLNTEEWPKIKKVLTEIFLTKTASEWQRIMSTYDTCMTQVVDNSSQIEIPQPKISLLLKSKL